MNICVVGTGYVGLVTGACFAEFGVQVVCADVDAEKIARLQRGEIPIYEPGLEDLVARNLREGRLSFTSDTAEAVAAALVVFIAVPTPPEEDGGTNLAVVESVAREIGRAMDGTGDGTDDGTVIDGVDFRRICFKKHDGAFLYASYEGLCYFVV